MLSVVPLATHSAACPNEKVKVSLVVILASEQGDFIDKRLKEFAKEVQEQHPNYKSFKIKTMSSKSLAPKEKGVFKLVDDKTAQIIVLHGADKQNRVSLAITAPEQGEIEYRTVCGKYLPIVTRCQTKTKERLMLAVQVQPCNE